MLTPSLGLMAGTYGMKKVLYKFGIIIIISASTWATFNLLTHLHEMIPSSLQTEVDDYLNT